MIARKSLKKQVLQKQLELRAKLWPKFTDDDLWSCKRTDGFTTVPRVMPLILHIMDGLAARPVSATYFDIWCRKFGEEFVTFKAQAKEYAFYAGFSGQRGEQTWRERVKELAKLGFINVLPGPYGDISYALILNPLNVIYNLAEDPESKISRQHYNALLSKGNEVKTKKFEDSQLKG